MLVNGPFCYTVFQFYAKQFVSFAWHSVIPRYFKFTSKKKQKQKQTWSNLEHFRPFSQIKLFRVLMEKSASRDQTRNSDLS